MISATSKKHFVSIKVKLVISIGSIVIVAISLVSYIFLYYTKQLLQAKTLEVCRNFASNIANIAREDLLIDSTYDATRTIIDKTVKAGVEGLNDVYVINVFGKYVVNFSETKTGKVAPEKDIRYIQSITDIDLVEIDSEGGEKNVLKISYPLFIQHGAENLKIGAAIFEYDKDKIYTPVYDMQKRMFFIGGTFLVFTLLITLYISIRTTDPILRLNEGVQIIASGDLDHKIEVMSFDEIGELSERFNEMTARIKSYTTNLQGLVDERTKELNSTLEIIRHDLHIAHKIQQNILPKSIKIQGLQISTKYLPMTEVGGDIFNVQEIKPGHIRIFIADATGHGVQAAMVTFAIKSEYENLSSQLSDPAEVLTRLNNQFIQRYGSLQTYFSCFLMDIKIEAKKLSFSSAGHPDQVLLRKKKIELLSRTGRLIGVKED
ncbi:MAG: SpoIIE family protein phosphatase, partial [Leptospira sp.]|nr:SpoIIE family protein phosphatase [Leptospira sp.]